MPTRTRRATCVQAVLTGTGWLLPNPRRTSAPTTLDQDKCPSTSAATNSPPLGWKALGASVRKVATWSIRWHQAWSEERTDRPWPGKAFVKNDYSKECQWQPSLEFLPSATILTWGTAKRLGGGGKKADLWCQWRGGITLTRKRNRINEGYPRGE